MEIESSIVASQQGLVVNPAVKNPQRESEARQQQEQARTELPPTQVVARQGSPEAQVKADQYRQQKQFYDQPDGKGRQAVLAYESLARQDKKEQLQEFLGVDTYV